MAETEPPAAPRRQRLVFGEDTELYDRARPPYPAPGGCLALFWNRPEPGGNPLPSQLDELYAALAPGLACALK